MCLHRAAGPTNNPTEKFTFFWKGPLSQWYPAEMTVDGICYGCAEQFMMAEKACLFNDPDTLAKIMAATSPRDQKALGREVMNFDRVKWDAVARDIVYKGNYAKFTQHPELRKLLLATVGTTLVEASPKDSIWGIGLEASDPDAQSRDTWQGSNWLGETLTKVRDNLIALGQTSNTVADDVDMLEASVKKLCEDAKGIYEKYCSDNSQDTSYWAKQFRLSTLERDRIQKALGQLSAITAIGKYDNIQISYHRGVRFIRSFGNPLGPEAMEPSGKSSAKILLYSGMDSYTENIPNEDVVR